MGRAIGAAALLASIAGSVFAIPARMEDTSAASTFFVDCGAGSDANSGSLSSPWATLNHARDVIRSMQPLTAPVDVEVLPGDCLPTVNGAVNFTVPVLSLSPEDSGTATAPISYRVYNASAETVLLSGGMPVPASAWQPYYGPIVQLNLTALGAAEYGFGFISASSLGQCSNFLMELFFNGVPMTLARYPNITPNGTWQYINILAANGSTSFTTNVSRVATWAAEPDPYVHGFWTFDWADNVVAVASIATLPSGDVQVVANPAVPPVYGFAPNARFLGMNLFCGE
jgi:hypothetical protein